MVGKVFIIGQNIQNKSNLLFLKKSVCYSERSWKRNYYNINDIYGFY